MKWKSCIVGIDWRLSAGMNQITEVVIIIIYTYNWKIIFVWINKWFYYHRLNKSNLRSWEDEVRIYVDAEDEWSWMKLVYLVLKMKLSEEVGIYVDVEDEVKWSWFSCNGYEMNIC